MSVALALAFNKTASLHALHKFSLRLDCSD